VCAGPTKIRVVPVTREGSRRLEDQGAFHRSEREYVRGFLPCVSAPASRSRRPHVLPMAGDKVLVGHCKCHLRGDAREQLVAPCVATSREQVRLFDPAESISARFVSESTPGTDDPSETTWLGLRGLSPGLIARVQS
jgi:hypothetical protein